MRSFLLTLSTSVTPIALRVRKAALHRESGLDGILVTIGLCIIALLLCVVMKDSLTGFIQVIVSSMTEKAQEILTAPLNTATGGLMLRVRL